MRGIIFNFWNTFTTGKGGKIIIKSFLSDNKSILKVKDKNRFNKFYFFITVCRIPPPSL